MPQYNLRSRVRHAPVIGTTILTGSPTVAEALAATPYEVLCMDLEHSATTIEQLEHLVRAADVHRTPAIVRVPEVGHYISRVLDAGASGIIVPRIETAAQAAEVVERARYAPEGKRGSGPGRGAAYGASLASPDHSAVTNASVLVAIQIESVEGVAAADEILATPGLDAVIIGPGDLALSLGVRMGSDEHWAAIDQVLSSAAAHGVSTGAFCFNVPDVQRYLDSGARLILSGGDLNWAIGGAMSEWHAIQSLGAASETAGDR